MKKTLKYKGVLLVGFIFVPTIVVLAQTTIISSPYSSTINIDTTTANTASVSNTGITCTDLTYDLYQGLGDSGSDQSVLRLQNYLNKTGYLLATPNGYFGPATFSAVKKFQTTYGISSTGRAGPMTRAKIKALTCGSNTASVINAVSTPTPTPVYTQINPSNITVSYPVASSTLTSDTKYRIVWKNIDRSVYSISLEDINGLGAGHIAQSVSGGEYQWTVGKVFSAKTNSEIFVKPGIYRIHMTNAGFNSNVPDQYSGLFTILSKPITIEGIIPSTISSVNNSSVAIYGNGFDETSKVNIDVYGNNRIIKPHYISPDGKIIVFNISSGLSGQFWLTVNNSYSDGATSTPSNPVSINIVNR